MIKVNNICEDKYHKWNSFIKDNKPTYYCSICNFIIEDIHYCLGLGSIIIDNFKLKHNIDHFINEYSNFHLSKDVLKIHEYNKIMNSHNWDKTYQYQSLTDIDDCVDYYMNQCNNCNLLYEFYDCGSFQEEMFININHTNTPNSYTIFKDDVENFICENMLVNNILK